MENGKKLLWAQKRWRIASFILFIFPISCAQKTVTFELTGALPQSCTAFDQKQIPEGMSFFASDRTVLFCDASGRITRPTQLACGLDSARLARIYTLWTEASEGLGNSLATNKNLPGVIYDTQELTANLLAMARYCSNWTLIEELAGLYLIASDRLSKSGREQIWPAENGNEEILHSSQFAFAVSYLLNTIEEIPKPAWSDTMKRYRVIFGDFLRLTLSRWTFDSYAMWIWPDCGVPSGRSNYLTSYRMFDYVLRKRSRALGGSPGAPPYCDAITEPELWVGAAATEFLSAAQKEPALLKEDSTTYERLLKYIRATLDLFESRLTKGSLTSERCTNSSCEVIHFDLDGYRHHPEYKDKVWKKRPTAWDISHARRWVNFLSTMYRHPDLTKPTRSEALLTRAFANQLFANVFKGDFSLPKFSNFMNGVDTRYLSYGPSELSQSYFRAGYGFWARFHQGIAKINQAFLDLKRSRGWVDYYNDNTRRSSNETLDELGFLSSLAVIPGEPIPPYK